MASSTEFDRGDGAPYWEGARQGKLRFQYCPACEAAQFPPRKICTQCGADVIEWRDSTLRGVIDSFAVVERAPNEYFKAKVPYVIALISLEEGFRVMVNLLGDSAESAQIGAPIRVIFEARDDGMVLPQAELIP